MFKHNFWYENLNRLVKEENAANCIFQEIDESSFKVANEEEVEDASDKHQPNMFSYFDHTENKYVDREQNDEGEEIINEMRGYIFGIENEEDGN